jgi:hypothetical protein
MEISGTEYNEKYAKLMAMKELGTERWDQNLVLSLMHDSSLACEVISARDTEKASADESSPMREDVDLHR